MSDWNRDFGAMLRAQRECRGITLEALAVSMKIRASLLADLEQNDLSRWPDGIYGRAFIRQYAMLVGLPPEAVLQRFCKRFPNRQEPPVPSRQEPPPLPTAPAANEIDPTPSSELRLTIADVASRGLPAVPSRVVDIVGALLLVLATGGVLALVTGFPFWTTTGVVALIWYPLSNAIYGREASLGRLLRMGSSRRAPSRAADAPLVLQMAGSEDEDVMRTFEGEGAEGERAEGVEPVEEADLPLTLSRQVH